MKAIDIELVVNQIDPDLAVWFLNLSSQEQDSLLSESARLTTLKEDTPQDWREWLTTLFPNLFSFSFANHHIEFWEYIESIQPGVKPEAFFAIWGRGSGKTTNAEAGTVRLGALDKRKFCLYVKATQDKANESVLNIAATLESKAIEKYYSQFASRKLGKYGHSKGWKVDLLRCGNGFSVIALGFDAAVRGVKIEEFRPDLIILDDIDDEQDSLETVEKKINILTTSILPAGSNDVAVIGIQNLMHPNSIFSQIVNNKAGFLHNRIVSGPYKAIDNLEYEQRPDEKGYQIIGGTATWEGQSLKVCEENINEWGLTSFLREAQNEVDNIPGGMFDRLNYRRCNWNEIPDLTRVVVWVDPAVSETTKSSSMGIQADGVDVENTIYCLWSWEQITSPQDALQRATLKAIELKADTVGVETDQGGDLWYLVYMQVCKNLVDDLNYPDITKDTRFPEFASAKAGAIGPKVHRANLMLTDYELGNIVHVRGTHETLENALNRFPKVKPFDLVDAAFWAWDDLVQSGGGVFVGSVEI